MTAPAALLSYDDPTPFEVFQPSATSPFLVLCDHAGRAIPRALGSLGISGRELETHIAWDIGAAGFAKKLASRLGATVFLQRYSRLVIDGNRLLMADASTPETSGGVAIPANRALNEEDRKTRADEIFRPYHGAIEEELKRRQAANRDTILVLAHSFTPELSGNARVWHTGLLYNRDRRVAEPLLGLLSREPGLVVGDNQPYFISDTSDYAANVYGEKAGRRYVELEIRQDLLASEGGQAEWAERYARLLIAATS